MKGGGEREHFGPEPNLYGGGPATVHAQVHEAAVGKTVAAVYLGDCKPFKSLDDDKPFYSEYLILEFTDGSLLPLTVGAGHSFAIAGPREIKDIVTSAKRAQQKGR